MQTHIDKLYFEDTFTVGGLQFRRSPENPETFEALVKSIRANGLWTPLVAYGTPDGRFLVLSGGRRLAALCKIREESPVRFDILFPEGMIPVHCPR